MHHQSVFVLSPVLKTCKFWSGLRQLLPVKSIEAYPGKTDFLWKNLWSRAKNVHNF